MPGLFYITLAGRPKKGATQRGAPGGEIAESSKSAYHFDIYFSFWERRLNLMRTLLAALFLASAFIACSGGGGTGAGSSGGSGNGSIQLSPMGTSSRPIDESINSPFTLTASEGGYSADFTARTIVGKCWVVQPPTTSNGVWTVAPDGLICIGVSHGDTEQIQVEDLSGHRAVTYIHSI